MQYSAVNFFQPPYFLGSSTQNKDYLACFGKNENQTHNVLDTIWLKSRDWHLSRIWLGLDLTSISCLNLWKMCVVDFNDNNRPPAIKGFKCQEHNLCEFEKRDYLRAILMQQHWNTNHFHISRKIFLPIFLSKSKWKFQGFHSEFFYIALNSVEG